jgi:hypothetical protein
LIIGPHLPLGDAKLTNSCQISVLIESENFFFLINLPQMKNYRLFFCWLFFLFTGFIPALHAQDLTGIWRGHFRSDEGLERLAGVYDDRYKMEVQIAQTRNHFEAVTYSYKSAEFYGKASATGSLNWQTKKVVLKEAKLLEYRSNGGVCIMTCLLQYTKLGNDEYLQGTYFSTNAADSTVGCGKGSIFLHRVAESDFHKEPFLENKERELARKKSNHTAEPPVASAVPPPVKKPETVKPGSSTAAVTKKKSDQIQPSSTPAAHQNIAAISPEPSKTTRDSTIHMNQPSETIMIPYVLKNRTNELLKTLTVHNTNIELRIYDDGAIDNDTVSVYYDNRLIVSNARLSDQPIIVHIDVKPSDHPHQLVMVAENLGDIPPNTSLLVVMDGETRYEERIISTEQKNVAINFEFKKIE